VAAQQQGSYVDDARTAADSEADQDGDGYPSIFDVRVAADTNLNTPIYRTTDPYFDVYVGGTHVASREVPDDDVWTIEIETSTLGSANLTRGSHTVRVELRNKIVGGSTLYDRTSFTVRYEPTDEDLTRRQRAVVGIESVGSTFDDAGNHLSTDYWLETQTAHLQDSFDAMFPSVPEDRTEAQYRAAETLIEETAPAGYLGTLTTVPTVVGSVAGTMAAGKAHSNPSNT
jgi:hypothetical protein